MIEGNTLMNSEPVGGSSTWSLAGLGAGGCAAATGSPRCSGVDSFIGENS
jgi:hypothetical protein